MRFYWWMIPVLLLIAFIGARDLNRDVIWFDELTSIGHAGGVIDGHFSPIQVWETVAQVSPKHAPLFFELLAGWASLTGWHPATLRVLSLFFGVLTIAFMYRLGKDSLSPQVGLIAAALMGTSVFWIEYYHEIRMYTLQMMLIVLLVWLYLRAIDPKRMFRSYHWLAILVTATALLYNQPYSFFVHVMIGIYHLLFVPKNRRWYEITGLFLLVGVLFLPWFPVTFRGVDTEFDTADTAMPLGQAIETFLRLFGNGNIPLLLAILGFSGWQLRDTDIRRKAKPFWILAIIILGILLVVNEVLGLIPLRRARYFFPAWALWSMLLAIGFAYFRRWWIIAGIMVLWLVSGLMLRDAPDYEDYQGTVSAVNFYPPMHRFIPELQKVVHEGDFLLGFTDANFFNHRGRHGRSTAQFYSYQFLGVDSAFLMSYTNTIDKVRDDFYAKVKNNPYLVFIYDPSDLPDNFEWVEQVIQENYVSCDVTLDQADMHIERYNHRQLGCEHDAGTISYENGISIVDSSVEYLEDEQTLNVLLGWQTANEQLLEDNNFSLQILNADWEKFWQEDRHLYDDILPWYRIAIPLVDLPAGNYRLVVIVYQREAGDKVNGTDLTSGESNTILTLNSFTITASDE